MSSSPSSGGFTAELEEQERRARAELNNPFFDLREFFNDRLAGAHERIKAVLSPDMYGTFRAAIRQEKFRYVDYLLHNDDTFRRQVDEADVRLVLGAAVLAHGQRAVLDGDVQSYEDFRKVLTRAWDVAPRYHDRIREAMRAPLVTAMVNAANAGEWDEVEMRREAYRAEYGAARLPGAVLDPIVFRSGNLSVIQRSASDDPTMFRMLVATAEAYGRRERAAPDQPTPEFDLEATTELAVDRDPIQKAADLRWHRFVRGIPNGLVDYVAFLDAAGKREDVYAVARVLTHTREGDPLESARTEAASRGIADVNALVDALNAKFNPEQEREGPTL